MEGIPLSIDSYGVNHDLSALVSEKLLISGEADISVKLTFDMTCHMSIGCEIEVRAASSITLISKGG